MSIPDLASDVPEPGIYGGYVCVSLNGNGCLHCLGILDEDDVRRYFSTEDERDHENKIYGIPKDSLGSKGPSVVSVNGVIASLAVTEFMVTVTGLRKPNRLLNYHGHLSKVVVNQDKPISDCHYCKGIRGKPNDADIGRYLNIPHIR